MTKVNVELTERLKAFADEQAKTHQLPDAGEYLAALLEREALEQALMEGVNSGPSIEVDDAWFDRKLKDLRERHAGGEGGRP